jgi:ribose 5-phosphate isomerase A
LKTDLKELKKQAAEKAVEYIQNGMIVGLGTGSTTQFAIAKIGDLINNGQVENIRCIPTSEKTEQQARDLKIALTSLKENPVIDITIDGADEVDPGLNLIKGGGGALLREKILAQASKSVIIIVDESKLSAQLGTNWAVPVEVVEFGYMPTIRYVESLGAKVKLRTDQRGKIFRTDEDNIILDCDFGPIEDIKKLSKDLNQQAAVAENGLFIDLASEVIVAGKDGIKHLKRD